MMLKQACELGNQVIGLVLYETLVGKYQACGLLVKQSWYHYVDITADVGYLEVHFFGVFELHKMDDPDETVQFVTTSANLDFNKKEACFEYSSPCFTIMDLVKTL